MVERLILPERLTRPARQFIGLFRGDSLYELGDLRSGGSGVDQKVDVIRHHDKRDEVLQGPDSFATPNGFRDAFGHLRIFEPAGGVRSSSRSAATKARPSRTEAKGRVPCNRKVMNSEAPSG